MIDVSVRTDILEREANSSSFNWNIVRTNAKRNIFSAVVLIRLSQLSIKYHVLRVY